MEDDQQYATMFGVCSHVYALSSVVGCDSRLASFAKVLPLRVLVIHTHTHTHTLWVNQFRDNLIFRF